LRDTRETRDKELRPGEGVVKMWCREPGKYWYAGDLRQLSVAPSGMKGLE